MLYVIFQVKRRKDPSMKKIISLACLSITLSGCAMDMKKETAGTLIGAAGGAIIGSQFGGGTGQILGTALGTAAGALAGNMVGKSMDQADKKVEDF
jgi:uncharacterized protein YcfJ